ncbi:MAG: hypothetical protein K0S78_5488 [Thermomicrobiales bacterium]|jgi:hypothetical protein|nr:hypothetical protein [Thermomicrobiales bacterium]
MSRDPPPRPETYYWLDIGWEHRASRMDAVLPLSISKPAERLPDVTADAAPRWVRRAIELELAQMILREGFGQVRAP